MQSQRYWQDAQQQIEASAAAAATIVTRGGAVPCQGLRSRLVGSNGLLLSDPRGASGLLPSLVGLF